MSQRLPEIVRAMQAARFPPRPRRRRGSYMDDRDRMLARLAARARTPRRRT